MARQELHPGPPRPDAFEERSRLVEEILASRSFAKAPRLSSLLAYICREALKGNHSELTERQIGAEVFGRSANYLTAEDSIVRASARLLRSRLEVYFSSEGKDSKWTVAIPKGSYVPVFERRTPASESPPPALPTPPIQATPTEPPAEKISGGRTRLWRISAAIAALAAVVAVAVLALWFRRDENVSPPSKQAQLWSQVLTPERRALFVPADTTLALIQTKQRVPLTLSEYLGQRHKNLSTLAAAGPLSETLQNISDHQYTSMADLDMAFHVGRLAQAGPARLEVRYARDLTMSEARHSNLILMGGPRADPWVQLFANRIDYSLDDQPADGLDYVNVRSPRGAEQARYRADVEDGETYSSLAVVALVAGLEGDGKVLLLEGTDMAGTEGACDFLLDAGASSAFLAKVSRPDGRLSNFELLLETKTVKGNSSEPMVLAYRTLP
jgi:hypothetical protein